MTDEYPSAEAWRLKQRVDAAAREPRVRAAGRIMEIVKASMDLIEEQSPAVLEALIELSKDMQRTDFSPARRAMRSGFTAYCEAALVESSKRERRLYYALTGLVDPDEDDKK